MSVTESFGQDFRAGAPGACENPGATALSILSIGLGIGLTTGTFSITDAMLLRPFPLERPREVMYATSRGDDGRSVPYGWPDYEDMLQAGEGPGGHGGLPAARRHAGRGRGQRRPHHPRGDPELLLAAGREGRAGAGVGRGIRRPAGRRAGIPPVAAALWRRPADRRPDGSDQPESVPRHGRDAGRVHRPGARRRHRRVGRHGGLVRGPRTPFRTAAARRPVRNRRPAQAGSQCRAGGSAVGRRHSRPGQAQSRRRGRARHAAEGAVRAGLEGQPGLRRRHAGDARPGAVCGLRQRGAVAAGAGRIAPARVRHPPGPGRGRVAAHAPVAGRDRRGERGRGRAGPAVGALRDGHGLAVPVGRQGEHRFRDRAGPPRARLHARGGPGLDPAGRTGAGPACRADRSGRGGEVRAGRNRRARRVAEESPDCGTNRGERGAVRHGGAVPGEPAKCHRRAAGVRPRQAASGAERGPGLGEVANRFVV